MKNNKEQKEISGHVFDTCNTYGKKIENSKEACLCLSLEEVIALEAGKAKKKS